ncbi:hypothetical protein [Burkholderia ubonensis]|uniref:hypothetical protein n=1 Tax=Burkholderia ubonensis TaxID=101571 RepID=UPI000A9BFF7C|nr:hypothetical protein [Burkholderia ubonensis]
MNLGERLKAVQGYQAELDRRAALLKKAESDEETLTLVLRTRHFFEYAFQLFEHRLLNHKAPGTIALGGRTFRDVASLLNTCQWSIPSLVSRKWRTEGKGIWTPSHALYAIWEEFEERCKAAGLEPQWTYAHDGVGMEAWYELTVTAAQ